MPRPLSILALFALLLPALAFAQAPEARTPVSFAEGHLVIETASGRHPFAVEIARTPQQRARGLMFRQSLPPGRGMLFLYPRQGPVYMWMKDTFVPLDMLFMDRDGKIVHVVENARPKSLDIISSWAPAKSVLEVPAGTAARLGVRNGDRVVYPAPE